MENNQLMQSELVLPRFETSEEYRERKIAERIEELAEPWRDREVLEYCYVEKGMTQAEVGERLGCSAPTVSNQLSKHGIKTTGPPIDNETLERWYCDEKLSTYEIAERADVTDGTVGSWLREAGIETRDANDYQGGAWREKETLEQKYIEEEKSIKEVAEELGCTASTISKHLQRNNIETRRPAPTEAALEAKRINHAGYGVSETGYEYWSVRDPEGTKTLPVHCLLAIADGADPHEVFADGTEVHHRAGHELMNLPSLLAVLPISRHRKVHREGEFVEEGGIPVMSIIR